MKNRILLALLLLSGSLHAQGETDEPGFIKIVQRANPLYLSVQGITSVSGKPNTITYPLVTNITTDQPGYPSIKGQSIVMTVEINCQTGQGRAYGRRVHSQHFGRGRLVHNFTATDGEETINLPELYKQPNTSIYLVSTAIACQKVGKPLAGAPEILRDILDGRGRSTSPWQ